MSTHEPDAYRLLGVSLRADAGTIRERYLALSRIYHPDRAGGSAQATSAFQRVAEAYRTLSDQQARERHDRELALKDPLRLAEDTAAERAIEALSHASERLRGRERALPRSLRGRDLWAATSIPFARALLGGRSSVAVAYRSPCARCDGSGSEAPHQEPACHVCGGGGVVRVGLRRERRRCGFCEGRGSVLLRPCGSCQGDGELAIERAVEIEIPPRCRDRATLRVRGGGEAGQHGGPAGDLIAEVRVTPDPFFSLEGDDVICRLPVTWAQAAIGGVIEVPSLEGVETLRLPAPIVGGTELRVIGRGAPGAARGPEGGGRGDLRYRVEIDTPLVLSAAARAGLEQLDTETPASAWSRVAQFNERVAANRRK